MKIAAGGSTICACLLACLFCALTQITVESPLPITVARFLLMVSFTSVCKQYLCNFHK